MGCFEFYHKNILNFTTTLKYQRRRFTMDTSYTDSVHSDDTIWSSVSHITDYETKTQSVPIKLGSDPHLVSIIQPVPIKIKEEPEVVQQLMLRLRELQLECDTNIIPIDTKWMCIMHVKNAHGINVAVRTCTGTKKQNAKKDCSRAILYALIRHEPPTTYQRAIPLQIPSNVSIVQFREPPKDWGLHGHALGVDFEGANKHLVQIACEDGVLVDRIDAPYVQDILHNPNSVHYIFGAHEEHLVANPVNLQRNNLSLIETYSRLLTPQQRYTKLNYNGGGDECAQKSRMDRDFLIYAATDAWATLQIGNFYARASLLYKTTE